MKIGIVGNTSKPKAVTIINRFCEILQQRGVDYVFAENLYRFLSLRQKDIVIPIDQLGDFCSVVVAFGGDGTILSTAREVGASGVPILGVNIGTLGFLAEVIVDELEATVDNLMADQFEIIDRMVLRVDVSKDYLTKTFYALNDVVVKGLGSRLLYIDAKVNDTFLNSYRGDGLIVATPTGSTAYSLSAGGPLVVPNLHSFIITPICPHSITVRPILLSMDSAIELTIRKEGEPAQVNIDGQNRYKLLFHERLNVTRASYSIKWISIGKRDFYEILRTKLNWGANHNNMQR